MELEIKLESKEGPVLLAMYNTDNGGFQFIPRVPLEMIFTKLSIKVVKPKEGTEDD